MTRPAIFLDRDGTIIEHVHHLCNPGDVRLLAGAADAIRALRLSGFACVVVTNQSVLGRGKISIPELDAIHGAMHTALATKGAALDGVYYCPVVPRQNDPHIIEHPDRKPGPGMLTRAAEQLDLDLARSWMIGDSLTDMLAGRNAGCGGTILVLTGQASGADGIHPAVDHVAVDLGAAAQVILSSGDARGKALPGRAAQRPSQRYHKAHVPGAERKCESS